MTDTADAPPAPPPEPLTVDEVKYNVRALDGSAAEDARIATLIIAARRYVERVTGLVLVPATITETATSFGSWILLQSWPIAEVLEIRHPVGGVPTALPTTAWRASIVRRPARIYPAVAEWGVLSLWHARDCFNLMGLAASPPIEIDLQAGFATPDAVPMEVKQAMQMLIAHWYDNRSAAEVGARAAAVEVPLGVEVLLGLHTLPVI